VDVNWLNKVDLKFNKWLTVSVLFHLIYEYNTLFPIYEEQNGEQVQVGEERRLQWLQSLGVGVSFTL
jgi:hypothetical protein